MANSQIIYHKQQLLKSEGSCDTLNELKRAIAQLVARMHGVHEAVGSSPTSPTNFSPLIFGSKKYFEAAKLRIIKVPHIKNFMSTQSKQTSFIAPTITTPPLPSTGLQTPGCYASSLHDCDGGSLSGEHYFSRSVLEAIGDGATYRGLPWMPVEGISLGINSFVANVLCKRHNSALSGLDTVAGNLFGCIRDITLNKTEQTLWGFSGYDVERWLIKLLLGMISSRNVPTSVNNTHTLTDVNIPLELLKILFSGPEPVEQGYFKILWQNGERNASDQFRVACERDFETDQRDHIIAEFMFLGFCFSTKPVVFGSGFQSADRPHRIEINKKRTIHLFWRQGSSGSLIGLNVNYNPQGVPRATVN